jgi:hypothetical protein
MVDQRRATMRGGAQQHRVQAGALLDQGAMEPEPVARGHGRLRASLGLCAAAQRFKRAGL